MAGDEADRAAASECDDDRAEHNLKRDTRPEDKPREDVAADLIGAEPELGGGRRPYRVPEDLLWIMRRDELREDRRENENDRKASPHTERGCVKKRRIARPATTRCRAVCATVGGFGRRRS